jgi:hypothetical protein
VIPRNSTLLVLILAISTTVVSYTGLRQFENHKTDVMPARQLNPDGSFTENHLVPSLAAWFDNKLFIGQTAKQLKSKLTYGRNLCILK